MKLPARFIQLPMHYDTAQLAAEVAAFADADWRGHPERFTGNDFVPLVAAHGDPANESFGGPMRPTPHLARMPYVRQVLASIGAVVGRTRLMRLSPSARVTRHIDVNYYWRERMRVHVPIITDPRVRFDCGDQSVHMSAGECWIFDTWSYHCVLNNSDIKRVHLVMDTVGGPAFWKHVEQGRLVGSENGQAWAPRTIEPSNERGTFECESANLPAVMSPWEMRHHLEFLREEAIPSPALETFARASRRIVRDWQAVWSAYGEDRAGHAQYKTLIDTFGAEARGFGVQIQMRNEVNFLQALNAIVLAVAVAAPNQAPVRAVGP